MIRICLIALRGWCCLLVRIGRRFMIGLLAISLSLSLSFCLSISPGRAKRGVRIFTMLQVNSMKIISTRPSKVILTSRIIKQRRANVWSKVMYTTWWNSKGLFIKYAETKVSSLTSTSVNNLRNTINMLIPLSVQRGMQIGWEIRLELFFCSCWRRDRKFRENWPRESSIFTIRNCQKNCSLKRWGSWSNKNWLRRSS